MMRYENGIVVDDSYGHNHGLQNTGGYINDPYYGGSDSGGWQAIPVMTPQTITTNSTFTVTTNNPYLVPADGRAVPYAIDPSYPKDDPIAWLKRRVQETIDEVDWAA